ncbi:hypothetical protein [Methylocystis sp.]|uniref:hypothetical protein n=1 Tax=Methylocystis sp. TaxID=1911079 RepID=UPI003DA4E06E
MSNDAELKDFEEFLTSLNLDRESHDAEVLLVTCIDFRFIEKVMNLIDCAGLTGKFDYVILAGAELGPVVDYPPDPKPHWQKFFLDHLALSKRLHNIKKVLVLGHRDCGAYREFELLPEDPDPQAEYACHAAQAKKFEALVKNFDCTLGVDKYLLSLTSPDEPMKFQAVS